MASDLSVLLVSTALIYKQCAVRGALALKKNWYWALLPAGYTAALAVAGSTAGALLGPVAGGLVLGLLAALCLANYLVVCGAGVRGELLRLREVWPETAALFGPVISVLFIMFLIELALGMLLGRPSQALLRGIASLVLMVVFNPLPEVVYLGRSYGSAMFGESLEFMKENALEWLAAQFLLLLPLLAVGGSTIWLVLASGDPAQTALRIPQLFSLLGSSLGLGIAGSVAGLAYGYFFVVCRGELFRQLNSTSRRKRIYAAKFN